MVAFVGQTWIPPSHPFNGLIWGSDHERSSLSRSSTFLFPIFCIRETLGNVVFYCVWELQEVEYLDYDLNWGFLGRELVVMHIKFSMFGKFCSACVEVGMEIWTKSILFRFSRSQTHFGMPSIHWTYTAHRKCCYYGKQPSLDRSLCWIND